MKKIIVKISFIFLAGLAGFACYDDRIDPRVYEDFTPIDSLEGTKWYTSEWNGKILDFISETTVRSYSSDALYVYDKTTRKGKIKRYGPFTISDDEKTLTVYVTQYGHDLDYKRTD